MEPMGGKAAGAAMLKRLRKRRGMSLAMAARVLVELAKELHQPPLPSLASVQRSIARWESARPTTPDDRSQLLLAHLYARTPSGELSLGAGSDFAEYLDTLRQFGESERRIADLRNLLLSTATNKGGMLALLSPDVQARLNIALADPSRTDEEMVASIDSVVSDVNAQVGSIPFVRLQLMLAPAIEVCRRLIQGPVPEPIKTSLRQSMVAGAALAGRLAFETRDDSASHALYAEATREATLLGQPWLQAKVHMSRALVTLYSTEGIEPARRVIDLAVRAARSGESVLIRARAHALQAEIAARAGQKRHAQAALGLAWYDMDADHADDLAPTSFTTGHLRGFEGVCELYIGDAAVAHDQFAQSVESLSAPREQIQRAIVATDLALARIRLGEPESAMGPLHECISVASTTGGRVPVIRLRRARQELQRWRREDFVADLDDHLIDVLGR